MANKETKQERDALIQRVQGSLEKAEHYVSGLSKTGKRLLASSIVSSAATTVVTGITAAQGPVVGSGTEGWRLACIVAAVLGFVTTITVGLNQQLKVGDRVSAGNQCIGRLRALDVSMVTGSKSWDEATKEYAEIVTTYPEPLHG